MALSTLLPGDFVIPLATFRKRGDPASVFVDANQRHTTVGRVTAVGTTLLSTAAQIASFAPLVSASPLTWPLPYGMTWTPAGYTTPAFVSDVLVTVLAWDSDARQALTLQYPSTTLMLIAAGTQPFGIATAIQYDADRLLPEMLELATAMRNSLTQQ